MKVTKGLLIKHKVLELASRGLSRDQIKRNLSLPGKTVRRFLVRNKGTQRAINFVERIELNKKYDFNLL